MSTWGVLRVQSRRGLQNRNANPTRAATSSSNNKKQDNKQEKQTQTAREATCDAARTLTFMEQASQAWGVDSTAWFDAGWASRLAERHVLLTTKDAASFYMVLVPGSHSVQIIEVERATGIFGNDTFVVRVDGFKEKFGSLSITDATNYCVQRVRGVLLGGDGGEDGQIGVEGCSEHWPLLLHALWKRKEWSVRSSASGRFSSPATWSPPKRSQHRSATLGCFSCSVLSLQWHGMNMRRSLRLIRSPRRRPSKMATTAWSPRTRSLLISSKRWRSRIR